jgi:hypothetical protein
MIACADDLYYRRLCRVYCHYTSAVDTNQIKFVLSAINDIISKSSFRL